MKTTDFSYYIERYLSGEMDHTEIKWFEKELDGNESLMKEVNLRRKVDNLMVGQDIIALRTKLIILEKERKEKVLLTTGKKAVRIRFAAIFTGLIIIGSLTLLSLRTQSTQTLYKNYYELYRIPSGARNAEKELVSLLNQGIMYYNNGDYLKAASTFRNFQNEMPGDMRAEFYSGLSNMENKNYPDASVSLKNVIKNNDNLYIEDSKWYLAMCYLATNNKEEARNQLTAIKNSENIYHNKARKILRKL